MKKTTKQFWFLGVLYGIVFSLFLILMRTGENEKSWSLILSSLVVAGLSAWLFVWGMQKQLTSSRLLKLKLNEDEFVLAAHLANYKLYGGKLILTNKRLCYVWNLWGVGKLLVDVPVNLVSNVQMMGKQTMCIFADGRKFWFRVDDMHGLHEKMASLKI